MAERYEFGIHYGSYDEEIIEKMYKIRFVGMPLSFLLLDRRKTDTFCHICASLLTFAIPGSRRVEGSLLTLDGETHSWVEIDNFVFDTSRTTMWLKDAYYENVGVLTSKVIEDEEVNNKVDKYLNSKGINEMYVAWIRELEENIEKIPYRVYLEDHIKRFKDEIEYDSLSINEEKVADIRDGINSHYVEIMNFKDKHPVLYKKDN